jgi:hypothetical protein
MIFLHRIPFHIILIYILLYVPFQAVTQYAPPVGQPGTTAIFKDSSALISWASTCTIDRGYINLADTSFTYNGSNRPTYGSYLYASGPADELVVSLGDHGSAVLGFDIPIVNRPGPDFAVFENSFNDSFLELGFVEASSDGIRFVRFSAVSLTPESPQVSTFDTIDATRIHNFAGKYRHGYGTPFDLEDLKDSSGIDVSNITHIRITDAGGCIQSLYAAYDSQGNVVNEPWPTPFDTGGFDLDAVGVINNLLNGTEEPEQAALFRVFPNPVKDQMQIISLKQDMVRIDLSDMSGRVVKSTVFTAKSHLDLSTLSPGIYIANFTTQDGATFATKIVTY